MNIIETFRKNNKCIEIYGTYEKPLFLAKQVGEALGLKNVRESLRAIGDIWKLVSKVDGLGGGQKMTFLKEPGLYQLIMRSNKKEAVQFQEWICGEVIPSIRKTGRYDIKHKFSDYKTFSIKNEFDLHTKVISFIKKRFPDSLFSASLGELQDTSDKRIKAYQMGYLAGSPDLIIMNLHKKYSGLVIEFKTPTGKGVMSDSQHKMLRSYENNGFQILMSNDYDQIIETILNYFKDVRIKCYHCKCKFKTKDTLAKHLTGFHKIDFY